MSELAKSFMAYSCQDLLGNVSHTDVMQKWEYQVFASHLDPAELVIILNESGREGWELVALVPVTDYYPPDLAEPKAIAIATPAPDANEADTGEADEMIPVETFRYIFKRPLQ